MAAAFHEVKVVELLQAVLLGGQRLDQDLFVVVSEHQDVGEFDRGVAADSLARRDALDYGLFRRTDRGGGADGVVIGVEIDHAHQAGADGAVV